VRERVLSRNSKLVLLLWLCFVARGCFYSALLPTWEGYDEPFHFSFIQYVAEHRSLPVPTTPVSREVEASLHLLPLSWEQRLHVMAPPIYTEDSYWRLSEAGRKALQEQLRAIPPAWGTQSATAPAMYEAQQAPLYYWMMAAPLRLAFRWPLAARVMLIRVLSVLLVSFLVPIAYAAAKKFFADDAKAIGIVAVIVCMPELMIDISRSANESLAIVVYSCLTLLLLLAVQPKHSRWFVAGGLVLGIGLLTKAYFLLAVPAFLSVALYSLWRFPAERKRILATALIGISLAALISFPWYWRNHVRTGAWSGEENDVVAGHMAPAHLIAQAAHVHWIGGITSVLVSHVWFGGWSFLKLPKAAYLLFVLGMAAVLLGLVKLVIKKRLHSGQLFVLLALYILFWIGLLYDILVVYIATGVSASDGWYMYAVIVPEMLLATCGLYSLTPEGRRWIVLPAMTAAFAAIDLYGVHALLAPYYTGVISHLAASDFVRPATLVQLVKAGPQLLRERLTANRPAWLSPPLMALFWVVYCIATIVPIIVSYLAILGHRNRANQEARAHML
jgi:4-amino-4-deoxy-L-arabinose transferase-like glycosyltransferase